MKVLFILNPTSGKISLDDLTERIRTLAARDKFQAEFLKTSGHMDDGAIHEKISQFKPGRIAACGGDGTVQLVARNIQHVEIPLGIIPLGSANGFATSLNIPNDTDEALDLLIHSQRTVPVDCLRINDKHLCIHMSDIGTNALLVKNFEEAGDKGMLGYAKHLFSSIRQSDLMKYRIITDEGEYEKEGYMLVIANAHKYGTGVYISGGSVSDGKFEICNVQKIDFPSAIKAGLTALNVFLEDERFSDIITCKQAKIQIERKAHLQIDGEYMGEYDSIDVKILASAVRALIIP